MNAEGPQRLQRFTWADRVAAILFALAATAASIGVAEGFSRPERGFVTDLAVVHGSDRSCTTIARVTTCRQDVDTDELEPDDMFGTGLSDGSDDFALDIEDLTCHQVEYTAPGRWLTWSDCASEAVWTELEIGDPYPPQTAH